MSTLLTYIATSWKRFFSYYTQSTNNSDLKTVDWATEWVADLMDVISQVLWVALAVVGAAGAIYAIWIGIKMAKAESSDEREDAKKHLIYVIIAVVAAIALIVFFNTLLPMILSACGLGVINETAPTDGGSPTEGTAIGSMIKTTIKTLRI